MKIDIKKEYERFIDNYESSKRSSLETEKPHLARWAYGACEEWIKDFEGSVSKTNTADTYMAIIKDKKQELQNLKITLRKKFENDKILMEMLK